MTIVGRLVRTTWPTHKSTYFAFLWQYQTSYSLYEQKLFLFVSKTHYQSKWQSTSNKCDFGLICSFSIRSACLNGEAYRASKIHQTPIKNVLHTSVGQMNKLMDVIHIIHNPIQFHYVGKQLACIFNHNWKHKMNCRVRLMA